VKRGESPQEAAPARSGEELAAQGSRRAGANLPSLRATLSIYTLRIE
jgi:hypothetical protein